MEDNIARAKLAERAERFDDMAKVCLASLVASAVANEGVHPVSVGG